MSMYESFSLWDAQKWIKGVSKGDSILFIYQLQEDSRRFRIKFSAEPPTKTPLQNCNDCISKLSPLIPIRDISASSTMVSYSQATQPPTEESQMFSQVQEPNLTLPAGSSIIMQTSEGLQSDSGENLNGSYLDLMSVSELAKEVSTDGKSLGKAYANTNFPVSQLSDFIRLCLTDSNFPAFVGAAEKELRNITN
ncbi:meiotic recombination protein REC114-like isoform X2 [Halichondria panicea]|uniref:meiotic recombination protein REC114-like isoform X2 n=1 Tax=Halichondria panicea TaxID=6063 RepID=UPI00312B3CBD